MMLQESSLGALGRGVLTVVFGAALVGALAGGTGCRGVRREATGTNIASGDVLSGRLAPQWPEQAFTFEGVESSLLDFTLESDEKNRSAPEPTLVDPEGKPIDLAGHRVSPAGAATTRYESVVLLRTGSYRLGLASTDTSADSWYLFRHNLRFPSVVDDRARLTTEATHPIYLTAPYGGTVSVKVRPVNGSKLQPELRGVVDPTGGRALDSTLTPQGLNPPQMAPTGDGGLLLVFVAPRSGRYTVLAAAKAGSEGEARIDVDVATPDFGRSVWHPGSDPMGGAAPVAPAPMLQAPTVTYPTATPTATSTTLPAPTVSPATFPAATATPPPPPPSWPAPAAAGGWSAQPAVPSGGAVARR